jgi:hypothetical protein
LGEGGKAKTPQMKNPAIGGVSFSFYITLSITRETLRAICFALAGVLLFFLYCIDVY